MTDIEQRAQKLLNDIQRRKNEKLADKVFREPERRAIENRNREQEETERLKQMEKRWNPYLEKAMQRVEQEQQDRDKLMNKFMS